MSEKSAHNWLESAARPITALADALNRWEQLGAHPRTVIARYEEGERDIAAAKLPDPNFVACHGRSRPRYEEALAIEALLDTHGMTVEMQAQISEIDPKPLSALLIYRDARLIPDVRLMLRQLCIKLAATEVADAAKAMAEVDASPAPAAEQELPDPAGGEGPPPGPNINGDFRISEWRFSGLTPHELLLLQCLWRNGQYGERNGLVAFDELKQAMYPNQSADMRERVARHYKGLNKKLVAQSNGRVYLKSKTGKTTPKVRYLWLAVSEPLRGTAEGRK